MSSPHIQRCALNVLGFLLGDPDLQKRVDDVVGMGFDSRFIEDPNIKQAVDVLTASLDRKYPLTLADLHDHVRLDQASILDAVDQSPPTGIFIKRDVDALADSFHQRRIINLLTDAKRIADSGDIDSALELIDQIHEGQPRQSHNRFSIRSWGEIDVMDLKPREWFWGDAFALGQMQAIFSQPGVGKSRIATNLARNQVLQIPFAGMPTGARPLRHLMIGSENSIHRLQYDIRRMNSELTQDQIRLLGDHIFLATIESAGDSYISLESPENQSRWKATIKHFKPDVLWVDPYGDIHVGDANSDSDTRQTLSTLSRIVRSVNPETGIVLIHHARTGASNIAQATGFDAGNFGKNSKAVFSACRCVVNCAPYDETESPPVVVVCGKNNNARRFDPFRLTLDEQTMTYDADAVDVEAWRRDVLSAQKASKAQKTTEPLDQYHQAVVDALSDGPMPSGSLHSKVKHEINRGDKYVQALIADCVHHGLIAKTPRMKQRDGRVLYGTPEQVAAIKNTKE